jgi:hypothetical protein
MTPLGDLHRPRKGTKGRPAFRIVGNRNTAQEEAVEGVARADAHGAFEMGNASCEVYEMLPVPIKVGIGETVERDGLVFTDVAPL